MALTHYVTLGRSGLRVSPFCLGTMTFGEDWGWGSSVAESEAILSRYLDLGGNFIDTANGYTKGHSEVIIGDYFARTPGRRDRVVIATKFMTNLYRGDPNGGGAGRKSIVAACEQSLRRLKTDYIDLYWLHFWDRLTPIDETMRALDDLVRAGKVRYLGFSDTPAWKVSQAQTIAQFRGWAPVGGHPGRVLAHRAHGRGRADSRWPSRWAWASRRGRRCAAACSPASTRARTPARRRPTAASGSRSSSPSKSYAIIDELIRVAGELNTTPAAVALAWLQARPGVTSTIIGARRMEQLEQNLAGLDITLTAEHLASLNKLSEPTLNFPAPFMPMAGMFAAGGTTINGIPSKIWPLTPEGDADRY